jgi:oligoendopeptidase F
MTYPTNWNLSRYFYTGLDDPKFLADIATILPMTNAFADKYKETFGKFTMPTEMLEFYTDYTKLSYDMAKPSYYLFYRSSLDTQDLEVTKKMWEVDYIYTEASNLLLFISQGWKEIGYDRIMEWSKDPLMSPYKNDLISTADGIKYILGEKEEYVLNLKSRPLGLAGSLHDELTGSYEFTMNISWESKALTEEEVRTYRQHTDRSIRREAYSSLRRVYNTKQNQIALGNIYTSIVKDWSTDIQMRGYPKNVMAQRNLSEQMDDEVVDMLLSEVEQAYPIYARYLKAKSKMLNLEPDFSIWDAGAPIGHSEKDFSFEEAYNLHLSVMKDFDNDFYDYSVRMIEEERIDAFPKKREAWVSLRELS